MNYFYDLPDDLIDMIYKELHKKNQNIINICITDIGYTKEQMFEQDLTDIYLYPEQNREYFEDPDGFLYILSLHCLFGSLKDWNTIYSNFDSYDMKMYFDS